MTSRRSILIGLLVTLVANAASAASASALEWLIEAVPLAAVETVTGSAPGTTTFTTELTGGVKFELQCASATWKGELKPKTTAVFGTWLFSECVVVTPSKCKLGNTLTDASLDATLAAPGLISFNPASGTLLEEVEVTGCAGEGEYDLDGKWACEVEKPAEPAVSKVCKSEAGVDQELKFGAKPLTIQGTLTFKLSGGNAGKKWGIE